MTDNYRNDENLINQYLKDISRIPVIEDKDEEKKLAILAKNGDASARDMLVTSNLRFVVNVAKKYQNQGLPFEDLISEGNIGILNAIDKFDPDKGYHFISYAVWWIKQAISKAVSEKSRMVRLPMNRSNELYQIQKAEKFLRKELGEEPEIEDIAAYTNLSVETVVLLTNISRDMMSLDAPYSTKDDSNTTLADYIEDNSASTEDIVVEESLNVGIDNALNALNEKEKEIIQMRFGLNGYTPMSLSEVGEIYSVTKERIRQIEKRAILRLQANKEVNDLKVYHSVA